MKLMIKKAMTIVLAASLMLSLTSCNTTEYTESERVIEASALSEVLSDSNTLVIDARSAEEYEKGHLVGAVNLPPSMLTISDPVSGTIAPKEKVEEVLGVYGISNTSNVYVYDNSAGVYASRVWWVLTIYGHENVKVINNGETAVVKSGLELTLDIPVVESTTYVAKDLDESMIVDIDDVKAVIDGTSDACIIDVRSQAEYDEGAIPTAALYPHTKNLYSDGTFKSARDIYLDYNDLGVDKKDEIILYCKSSFRATQTALVLEEAGYENVKVYDGAWLEWSTKDMPQEEKKEETVTPSSQDGS